jgi:hypothetical protein
MGGLGEHRDHPTVVQTRERIKRFGAAAANNLVELVKQSKGASISRPASRE